MGQEIYYFLVRNVIYLKRRKNNVECGSLLWYMLNEWESPLFDQENVPDNQIIFLFYHVHIQKKYSSSRENLDFWLIYIIIVITFFYVPSSHFIIYVFTVPKMSKNEQNESNKTMWNVKNKQLKNFLCNVVIRRRKTNFHSNKNQLNSIHSSLTFFIKLI